MGVLLSNLSLISQEGHHALGDLLAGILLQVVTRVSHYLKTPVWDHFGDALSFSRFECDVPVGEHDQHWNVPVPEDRAICEMYAALGCRSLPGIILGKAAIPAREAAVGWGILYCSITPASRAAGTASRAGILSS